MLFSILIPTLEERHALFTHLYAKLETQTHSAGLQTQVEICFLSDNHERTLGTKRNALVRMAHGEFMAFVDDDDDVSDDYIGQICGALQAHPQVDCLGIRGTVYFRGAHPRQFIYSLQYDHYFSNAGVYYRPPYILNPIRRSIAQEYAFEDIDFNEDIDWALRLARDRALKSEEMLDKPIYFYFSRRHWLVQAAIDATEPIRHPLGLQFVNRVRFARWLRNK